MAKSQDMDEAPKTRRSEKQKATLELARQARHTKARGEPTTKSEPLEETRASFSDRPDRKSSLLESPNHDGQLGRRAIARCFTGCRKARQAPRGSIKDYTNTTLQPRPTCQSESFGGSAMLLLSDNPVTTLG